MPRDHDEPGGRASERRDRHPEVTGDDVEYVAGLVDGGRAGRAAMLNAVRPELARFRRIVDEDGEVSPAAGPAAPAFAIEPVPRPDNPEELPAYFTGWDRGFAEAQRNLVRRLRAQLDEDDLFVSDAGSVTTMEVASRLVDFLRIDARRRRKPPLDDAALHRFLDCAMGDPTGSPSPADGGGAFRAS